MSTSAPLAVFTGSRRSPAVELRFEYEATHPVTGEPLREWVKNLPAREFEKTSKRWTVTAFVSDPDRTLLAAGFTVIGPDDRQMSIGDYSWPDAATAPMPSQPTTAAADLPTELLHYDGTLDGLRGVPTSDLGSVDRRCAESMSAFEISNVWDLIHHIPRRYIDLSNPVAVTSVEPGEKVAVVGTVTSVNPAKPGQSMSQINVRDNEGTIISCRFFNAGWMMRKYARDQRVILHGKVETWEGRTGRTGYGMTNPLMDIVSDDAGNGMLPVYPQSAKADVDTWKIHRAASEAIDRLGDLVDPIPPTIIAKRLLIGRREAYVGIHSPANAAVAEASHQRLAYDELLRLQLSLLAARAAETSEPGMVHDVTGHLTRQLVTSLPFPLTGAQDRCISEISADLSASTPMNRLLQGDVGSGKAQPLDSLILTAEGFKTMGEMAVGTEVVNPTGHLTTVTGVFPQGPRQVFKVHLSDGTFVRADGEHLWSVRTSVMRHRDREPKTMTTHEIAADLTEKNGAHKWHIDMAEPVDLGSEDGSRPLDPYLLGVLLGDGSIKYNGASVTAGDPEQIELLHDAIPSGTKLRVSENPERRGVLIARINADRPGAVTEVVDSKDLSQIVRLYDAGHSITQIAAASEVTRAVITKRLAKAGIALRHGSENPVIEALTVLGLMGAGAESKFVPAAYLNAPIKVRHEVLQGLLDTDGTLDYRTGYNVTFSTVSPHLAQDVAWLVRSLGGLASVTPRHRSSGESFHVRVTLPGEYEPFRLERKAMWVHARSKYAHPARAITSIEADGFEDVQCIMVAHPNHLYVTDNFTVTHNTLVAAMALLAAVEGGHQGALMAPTEILASQHYAELAERLADVTRDDMRPVKVALLTNKVTGPAKKAVLAGLADGSIDIVVGTHSLLAASVKFAHLGLAVIDEQHRFGVEQRALFREKGADGHTPDMLVATATPIPRTAVLTVFGDLDSSVLDEMPPGRTPIVTTAVGTEDARLDDSAAAPWSKILAEVARGRQAFVVCPMVSESETKAAAAAESTADALREGALAGLRIGIAHGKQKPDERTAVMASFAAGDLDVLVATTVIEVGVNVPNATVMAIVGAERFGLAQLHQLRGRVGRGLHPGFCILVGDARTADSQQRIQAMCETTDGFKLSEVDLQIRGWGTLLGGAQAGSAKDLRVADLFRDAAMIEWARSDAMQLLENDPKLARRPQLRDEVRRAVGDDAGAWLTSA